MEKNWSEQKRMVELLKAHTVIIRTLKINLTKAFYFLALDCE